METKEERFDKLRVECWNNSLTLFGMAYIFDKRAHRHSIFSSGVKIFGIIVPVVVGATAIGYGFDSKLLKMIITVAIPLSIIQLIFSVLAVIFKWEEELAYDYEASQDMASLSSDFKALANLPPEEFDQLKQKSELLKASSDAREQQNTKHNIKEWELRMGMRYALREFQRQCAGCKKVPLSMESTDCDVCGKFGDNWVLKIFKL